MRDPASHRDERGSALVEAAIVLPLVFLFILGGADLGLWVFGTTQASNASRDGARVGILRYAQADVATSADAAAVRAAVTRRLARRVSEGPVTVAVRCVNQLQTTAVAGGCAQATPINRDKVEVTVTWQRRALSVVTVRFGSFQTVTSRSTMAILGRPAGAGAGT